MGLDRAAGPAGFMGVGKRAHLLVGALAHSSKWRGVLANAEDFPHLVEAIDQVLARLGGVTRRWRFDRMATVAIRAPADCGPSSLRSEFASVAKHYGVAVDIR
ncbi:hypothetical protein [Actinopolymorpha pittospori]|uniref:Transposase n=1 Tax=Actinopolymorpha pittospori TaxID=648752 RepID=A0A927MR42_9ACTN|nr:hypothetical protein [Actinopolymorpha pittospori]MBE1604811.1 transposase [Actinopolymorpha pittospori]